MNSRTSRSTSSSVRNARMSCHRSRPYHNFCIEAVRSIVLPRFFARVYPASSRSEAHLGRSRTPERLRRRILTNPGYSAQRSCSTDSPLEAVGSGGAGTTLLAVLFIPPIVDVSAQMRLSRRLRQRIGAISKAICPWKIHSSSPAAVTSWFAGKVPFHFQLPESQQTGSGQQIYRLVGSRLIDFKGSYAALTTYEMQEQKISLLVISDKSARAEGGEEVQSGCLTFHDHNIGGFKVTTWIHHGLTYALVSSLPGSARQSCLVCHREYGRSFAVSTSPVKKALRSVEVTLLESGVF